VLLPRLQLDAKENDEPIFDGRTLHGWTTLDGSLIDKKWEVIDGMIHLKPGGKNACVRPRSTKCCESQNECRLPHALNRISTSAAMISPLITDSRCGQPIARP